MLGAVSVISGRSAKLRKLELQSCREAKERERERGRERESERKCQRETAERQEGGRRGGE